MADILDTVGIEIESGTKNVSSSVDRVIQDLQNLNSTIKSTSNFTDKLRENFSKLGVNLDGSKLKSTLSSLSSDTLKYNTTSGQTVTVTKKVKNGMDDLKVSVRNVNNEVNKTSSVWSRLTSGFSKISREFLTIFGITKGAMTLKEATKNATEYEEALNLFTVTMGSKAQQATKWVERFSKALYIDDSSLMQYMGSLNSLTKGLGVTSDKAYIMSKNLTQLVYDLSSFKNLDIETSFRKIQSAMSGEIEPLRNVGVALSQNTLQELANELGIQQRVAAMSEAQKAQLRYIQILRSTTEWQGDMARTLVSPANALRVLQQQFTLLGRAIGRMFIPFVMKAIPYIMALTQMITDLANRIASFFGYKITDIDYSSLEDIQVGIEDIGDTAEDTASKLNTMLAPFDELNVVQKQSQSSGSGLGALGGDLGLDLPEYDALAGLTKEFSKNVDKARQDLERLLPVVLAIGSAFATWKIFKGTMKFLSLFAEGGTVTKGMSVLNGVAGKLGLSLGALSAVLTAVVGTTIVGVKSSNMIKNAFKQLEKNNVSLRDSFNKLDLGKKVLLIYSFMAPISRLINVITILKQVIKELASGKSIGGILGEWFPNTAATLDKFKNAFSDTFGGIIDVFKSAFGGVANWVNDKVVKPTWDIVSGLFNGISLTIQKIGEIIYTIGQIVVVVGSEIFRQVGNFIDGIVDLVRPVVDTIYNVLKPIVDTVYDKIIKPITGFFTGMINDIVGAFNGIANTVAEGFNLAFKTVLNTTFSIIEAPINLFIDALNVVIDVIKKIPGAGKIKKLEKLKIPRFEEGGFPQTGEFFLARESGAEMVGRIGNKTAVANNDQITTSITNALVTALSGLDLGGGRGTTVVNIGSRKVFEGMGDYVDSENDRYGTNYVHV